MIQQAQLANGIRVIMEPMDNLRSVSIGVWVNAGSVYESGADAGVSHFIEHMVFKGTNRRSAADIAAEMDAVGGNLNAFTAKECTCFYAKVLDEDLPLAVDMLADITLHPALDEQEMEKEKRVAVKAFRFPPTASISAAMSAADRRPVPLKTMCSMKWLMPASAPAS